MTDYKFKDKYFDLVWLKTGTWYYMQLIITLLVLYFYSPSHLKNLLTSNQEVRTEHGRRGDNMELDDVDTRAVQDDTVPRQHIKR